MKNVGRLSNRQNSTITRRAMRGRAETEVDRFGKITISPLWKKIVVLKTGSFSSGLNYAGMGFRSLITNAHLTWRFVNHDALNELLIF